MFGSAYIYRRAMFSAFDRTRAYISGWLLARRRERWRMSEIAGEERAEEPEGGCAKGNGIHTRQRLRGVAENRSGLNINDGHIGENVVAVFRGEISWEKPLK